MGYDSQYILTIVGSFFFHLAVSEWLAYPLPRKLSPGFLTLPANRQVLLRNSVMSICHAAIIGGRALYMFLFVYGATPLEDLWFQTPFYVHAACFSLAHMAADSLLMTIYVPLRDWKMILHHAIVVWGCNNAIAGPTVQYVGNT
ncbi:TMEM56 [Branchiostoma lanceolatum]|uniref:TMEM56 protein n=1 Tax=Branchiostoma lanceolatum TaxID=7740 RepID=A0A8J9YQ95_BRALA|nr:TMEM56 [Branchiostoma lanceolatum]